jgi:hypothetical protein
MPAMIKMGQAELDQRRRIDALWKAVCRRYTGKKNASGSVPTMLDQARAMQATTGSPRAKQFAQLLLRRLPQYGHPSLPKYGQPWVSDALPSAEIDKAVGWLARVRSRARERGSLSRVFASIDR